MEVHVGADMEEDDSINFEPRKISLEEAIKDKGSDVPCFCCGLPGYLIVETTDEDEDHGKGIYRRNDVNYRYCRRKVEIEQNVYNEQESLKNNTIRLDPRDAIQDFIYENSTENPHALAEEVSRLYRKDIKRKYFFLHHGELVGMPKKWEEAHVYIHITIHMRTSAPKNDEDIKYAMQTILQRQLRCSYLIEQDLALEKSGINRALSAEIIKHDTLAARLLIQMSSMMNKK